MSRVLKGGRMTVDELLAKVDESGGILMLSCNRVVLYHFPDHARHLAAALDLHHAEVLRVLRRRLAVAVNRFLREQCVVQRGLWVNTGFLHREFVNATRINCTLTAFAAQLERDGFVRDDADLLEGLAVRRVRSRVFSKG